MSQDKAADDGDMPPLEPEWLLEPLPKPDSGAQELEVTDSRFESISALVLKGEYVLAGRQSETLLREQIYDVRVLGYYLFGVFIERGIVSLPIVFRAILRFLGEEYALFGPTNKKQIQTENMLLWLIAGILKTSELHSTLKDATWKQWLDQKNRPAIDEAMQLCPQIQAALAGFSANSRAALRFSSLDNWLSGLGQSETGLTKRPPELSADSKNSKSSPVVQASKTSSEQSKPSDDEDKDDDDDDLPKEGATDDDDDDDEDDDDRQLARDVDDDDDDDNDDDDDDEDDDVPAKKVGRANKPRRDDDFRRLDDDDDDERTGREERPPFERLSPGMGRRRAEAPGPHDGSPEWQRLCERLQAFTELVEQGQYLKAAVVATDIQAAVASFDPVVYFPALFEPYLSAFADHMRPLEHYLNDPQAVKFKVLRQLYQVDFDKFMKKD